MQAVQIHNGFFVVLERGEDFVPSMTKFCEEQEVHWAAFSGIGALEDIQIGYYDLPNRQYVFRDEPGIFEVASMTGNVSEVDEQPDIHTHAALSRCDETLETIGGHLKSARVAVTLEVCLWFVSQPLTRSMDDETGLNLINVSV